MSDVLIGGLIAIGSAVVGGAVTGYFSLYQEWRRDNHEQQSIRTLVSLEILQNLTAVEILRAAAGYSLDYKDARDSVVTFFVATPLPHWETARWKSEAVGRHLKPSQLMRIGEWYTKLDGLTLLYQRIMSQLQHLPTTSDGHFDIKADMAEDAVRQIRNFIDYAADLIKHSPPLPDAKLSTGESIPDYLADLQQRQPKVKGKPEEPEAGEASS
jgi:hypothetical protein